MALRTKIRPDKAEVEGFGGSKVLKAGEATAIRISRYSGLCFGTTMRTVLAVSPAIPVFILAAQRK